MTLVIDPPVSIPFLKASEDEDVCATIQLENRADKRILFKVRVNVLKLYTVKPAISVIHPGERITVKLYMSKEGLKTPRVRDKLLLQYFDLNQTYIMKEKSLLEEWKLLEESNERAIERMFNFVIVDTIEERQKYYTGLDRKKNTPEAIKVKEESNDVEKRVDGIPESLENIPLVVVILIGVLGVLLGYIIRGGN
eukprot:GHVP01053846.1.p1 GENE.GHVP01053846.1~~GHVP01053846.1.p1  ORF type:complete len:195 (+),score=33.39 GHVP01053846.1:2-586(+)